MLQAGGACHSWRLQPPRWLGGKNSIEAHKEIVCVAPKEQLYGVLLLIPTEDHKEKNLVEGGVKCTK